MKRYIEAYRFREQLMREHDRFVFGDKKQDKWVSAGLILALAELDSQPTVEAIPISWLEEVALYKWHHTYAERVINDMIELWRKDNK